MFGKNSVSTAAKSCGDMDASAFSISISKTPAFMSLFVQPTKGDRKRKSGFPISNILFVRSLIKLRPFLLPDNNHRSPYIWGSIEVERLQILDSLLYHNFLQDTWQHFYWSSNPCHKPDILF